MNRMDHCAVLNKNTIDALVRSLPKRIQLNAWVLVTDLLLSAHRTDGYLLRYPVARGQVVFGRTLCEWLGISVQSHKTLFRHLRSAGFLTVETTAIGRVGTIIDFDTYSPPSEESDRQSNQQVIPHPTDDQPPDNRLLLFKRPSGVSLN
jgi:hypothetical protein